ncbi:MAG: peptidase [Pirellulaceae bacterium]|nr:MAG: peptidase [Pirellulaceae bacterium]
MVKKPSPSSRRRSSRLPTRQQVPIQDTWDLSVLFPSDEAWHEALEKWQRQFARLERFRGKLAESADTLAACLECHSSIERAGERLGAYAYLKAAEDQTNSAYQQMLGRFRMVATRAQETASFVRPEILAIPQRTMQQMLQSPSLARFRLLLQRLLRYRRYTLSDKEERLLAMQSDMLSAVPRTFRQLYDADIRFGTVTDERGRQVELTNATFLRFLESPSRKIRRTAFHQYYSHISDHQRTLASLLYGSVQSDVYHARVRGYPSSLAHALFEDNIPESVYHGLIDAVHQHLPVLYRYYELRRKLLRLKSIHHYDTYVPLFPQFQVRRTWDQAVQLLLEALRPLGEEYVRVLGEGLSGRWADRYPNIGKQSGAFSYGIYDSTPFILMNYKPDLLDDVFTLAHEAGHAMHSYYSARHQPFEYYHYSIFVAEVASTFNEELLLDHLVRSANNPHEKAFLINRELDSIRATLFRQTMFAEFEYEIHRAVESGEPLTDQTLRQTYRKLLEKYFGPDFTIDDQLELECLRIPHFYRAFYVYQYATGISAAIALSRRVLEGGARERDQYLEFLCSGCRKFPLELLRDAGVDFRDNSPVHDALEYFRHLLEQLEQLVG